MTFVELLNAYRITIPKIQRDYAQGRVKYNKKGIEITSEKPYQVRTGLVKALYDGVANNKSVDLNFVYGKKDVRDGKDIFIPIDGQQRLTTLFLFHWFIFQRANLEQEVKKLGEQFCYESRDTTRDFCRELCKQIVPEVLEYRGEETLSELLTDKIWFTSSYANDPSVQSMLTMLDTIANKFISEGQYVSESDYAALCNLLKDPGCPITFSSLPVNNFDDEDMYIKMNARGKELTYFEIFKAKLEEEGILEGVCYDASDSQADKSQKKISFIGKYNNEFTNLFYAIPEIGKDKFDMALFRFVECFVKLDHYSYITGHTQKAISEEDYNDDFLLVENTGSSLYNDYVLNPILHKKLPANTAAYMAGLRVKAKQSLRKSTAILDFLYNNGFAVFPPYKESVDIGYNEKQIIIKNREKLTNNNLVIQNALFSFLYVFDCTGQNWSTMQPLYLEWKRYVWNITYRFTIKDAVNFAKMIGVFDAILLSLRDIYDSNQGVISRDDILSVIRDYRSIPAVANIPMDAFRYLFDEEAGKAQRMLDPVDGSDWSRVITKAEAYYNDGNLKFLLDSIGATQTPSAYEEAFEKSTHWLTPYKSIKDPAALNEALLCLSDPADEMGHMIVYSDDTWQLLMNSQGNLREVLLFEAREKTKKARKGFIHLLQVYALNDTPRSFADSLIAAYVPQPNNWLKNTLIQQRLVKALIDHQATWKASGTIGRINPNKKDEYILFYATAYNSYNVELYTYILAMQLIGQHPDLYIEKVKGLQRTSDRRYVKLNQKRVNYHIERGLFYNVDTKTYFTDHSGDRGMADAIAYLTT